MKVSDKINILVGEGNWTIRNKALQSILDTECKDDEIPEFGKNGRDIIATVYTGAFAKSTRPIQVHVKKAGLKTQKETGKEYIVS